MPTVHQTPTREVRGRADAALRFACLATGAVTLTAQALLLRELMVSWQGNEISIGIALGAWLASTGAGSTWGAAFARRRGDAARLFAATLAAVGLFAPLSVGAARVARPLLGIPPGELAGPLTLMAATAATLVPLAFAGGVAFAAAVAAVSRRTTGRGRAVAVTWVSEALGALLAGLATSLVLFERLAPIPLALLATALALLGAAAALRSASPGPRRGAQAAACILALGAAAAAISPFGGEVDRRLVAAAWAEAGAVSSAHSRYGLIVAAERGSQRSLFENGVLVASVPDRAAAEEAVHLALLQHPRPRRVLLLGGVLGGAPAEVLKHPSVRALDCVELDPDLVRAAQRAFGREIAAGLADPRVSVSYADARFFVKATRGPYDAVIVNGPDPTTTRTNRLYTVEFMREVRALLAPEGVAAFSLASSEDYVGEELARLLASVDRSLREVFGAVLVTPGDPCHIIGAARADHLSLDARVLESRVQERRLDLAHVRGYYLADRLRPDRVAALEARLASVEVPVNEDLAPACTYPALVLWSERVSQGAGPLRAARELVTLPNAALAAAALAVALAAARRVRRSAAPSGPVIGAAVAVAGFTGIGVELAALAALQSIYGFVYHAAALVVGLFMAGLALGGWLGGRAASRGAGERVVLALSAGLAAAPPAVAWAAHRAALLAPATWPGAALLSGTMAAAAVLSGALFPAAAALLAARRDPAASAARLYAADLLGAAAGALICSVALLPLLGIVRSMAALALLNAAVALQALPLTTRCPAAAGGGAVPRP